MEGHGMTRANTTHRATDSRLAALFGDTTDTAVAVLTVIDSDTNRWWQPAELSDLTGLSLTDVMVVVARLTVAHIVHHNGLGSGYQSTATDTVNG
jgi:hypothetical protein